MFVIVATHHPPTCSVPRRDFFNLPPRHTPSLYGRIVPYRRLRHNLAVQQQRILTPIRSLKHSDYARSAQSRVLL